MNNEDAEWERQRNIDARRGNDLRRAPDPDRIARHLATGLPGEGAPIDSERYRED